MRARLGVLPCPLAQLVPIASRRWPPACGRTAPGSRHCPPHPLLAPALPGRSGYPVPRFGVVDSAGPNGVCPCCALLLCPVHPQPHAPTAPCTPVPCTHRPVHPPPQAPTTPCTHRPMRPPPHACTSWCTHFPCAHHSVHPPPCAPTAPCAHRHLHPLPFPLPRGEPRAVCGVAWLVWGDISHRTPGTSEPGLPEVGVPGLGAPGRTPLPRVGGTWPLPPAPGGVEGVGIQPHLSAQCWGVRAGVQWGAAEGGAACP